MSYLRPPMRAYPTRFRRPAALGDACCSSCARGGACASQALGDDVAAVPMTLDQRVAAIQQSAADYVKQDAFYKKLQIAAVLLIPLAGLITKTILHVRRGDPIL